MNGFKCINCNKELLGSRRKFCNLVCKARCRSNQVKANRLKQGKTIIKKEEHCIFCQKDIPKGFWKFCSTKCKDKDRYIKMTDDEKNRKYKVKDIRNTNRKLELMKLLGGACEHCGYCKNLTALCFHHKDPKAKLFEINIMTCSRKNWDILVEEANKCSLLCMNCHMELHYPHRSMIKE